MEGFNRIQKYLYNLMSEDEKQLFEDEVRNNKVLSIELETARFEMEMIDQLEEDSLRAEAKELSLRRPNSNIKNKRSSEFKLTKAFLIALVALVLYSIIYYSWRAQTEETTTKVIAMAYNNSRLNFGNQVTKGDHSNNYNFSQDYIFLLKNRDVSQMPKVIEYFKSHTSNDSHTHIQARLNMAHAHLIMKSNSEAHQIFYEIIQSESASAKQKEEAELFIALSTLGNQKETSLRRLQKLSNEGEYYDAIARSIVNEYDM